MLTRLNPEQKNTLGYLALVTVASFPLTFCIWLTTSKNVLILLAALLLQAGAWYTARSIRLWEYTRDARLQDSENKKLDVYFCDINVGQTDKATVAAIRHEIARSLAVSCRQLFQVLQVALLNIKYIAVFIPVAFFWVGVLFAIKEPDVFFSMMLDPSQSPAMFGKIMSFAIMVGMIGVIVFCLLNGGSSRLQIGIRNMREEELVRQLRVQFNVVSEHNDVSALSLVPCEKISPQAQAFPSEK